MKVFVFDLLAYDANLDHLKNGGPELPYPLAKEHFDADTAMRTYEEHLDAWELLDKCGYDGVGFNEHHCSPYGLMNSPNLMASAAAQRTKNLKLLIYGNLLPLHEPLRLAEELAMIDCLSNGRLISGFARGIPREYQVHNVALAEFARAVRGSLRHHHPRLDRGGVLLRGPVLVVPRRRDVAAPGAAAAPADLGPGDRQQGVDRVRRQARPADHPRPRPRPRACATTSSAITRNASPRPATASRPTICRSASPPMSPIQRPRRSRNTGRTSSISTRPCSATATSPRPSASAKSGYSTRGLDRLRAPGEPARRGQSALGVPQHDDARPRGARPSTCRSAPPTRSPQRIIAAADSAGANQVQLAMNRGALPHDLFMAQIERFARDVLPILQAHEVKTRAGRRRGDGLSSSGGASAARHMRGDGEPLAAAAGPDIGVAAGALPAVREGIGRPRVDDREIPDQPDVYVARGQVPDRHRLRRLFEEARAVDDRAVRVRAVEFLRPGFGRSGARPNSAPSRCSRGSALRELRGRSGLPTPSPSQQVAQHRHQGLVGRRHRIVVELLPAAPI